MKSSATQTRLLLRILHVHHVVKIDDLNKVGTYCVKIVYNAMIIASEGDETGVKDDLSNINEDKTATIIY